MNLDVTSPDFKPITEKTRPESRKSSIYRVHVYWAKKPWNVTAKYIKHFTNTHEVVLDPFCGCGVTVIEALRTRRKAVAIDLNPLAAYITRMTAISPVNLDDFKRAFQWIENKVKDEINTMYETKCRICRKKAVATYIHYDNNKPTKVKYRCKCLKRGKGQKKPDKIDLEKIKEFEEAEVKYWYPKVELVENTRVNIHKGTTIADLFTRRNLLATAMLLDAINSLPNSPKARTGLTKELMRFAFSSGLHLMKKTDYKAGSQRPFYIPPVNWVERNVWTTVFEGEFNDVYKVKDETNGLIRDYYREADDFSDLFDDKTVLILTQDSRDLTDIIPDNSIDYVMTDPPYGDQYPYFEYALFWISWLQLPEPNLEKEIVISDSPVREKRSIKTYRKDLIDAFKEIGRVLKPNKWASIWFRCQDPPVWKSLTDALSEGGLEKKCHVEQPDDIVSYMQSRYNGAIKDYLLVSCQNTGRIVQVRALPSMETVKERFTAVASKVIIRKAGADWNDIWTTFLSGFLDEYGVPPHKMDYKRALEENFKPRTEIVNGREVEKWYLRSYKPDEDPGKLLRYLKEQEPEP